jgi:hypothetical protein
MTSDIFEDASNKSFPEGRMTTERLIDEIFLHLARKTKYVEQTRYLLYRIPVYKPIPEFIVFISDLYDALKQELDALDDHALNRVMREAIGRLFENENQKYYLLSVKRLLRWRFEK